MSFDADHSDAMVQEASDPALVFFGATLVEALAILAVSTVVWWAILIPLGVMIGMWRLMFGISFPAIVATVLAACTALSALKRGKPPGYYRQVIAKMLGDAGLVVPMMPRLDGVLEIGRTRQIVVVADESEGAESDALGELYDDEFASR